MTSKAKKHVILAMQIALAALAVAGAAWLVSKAWGYTQAQGVYREMQAAYAAELGNSGDDAPAAACPVDFAALQEQYPGVVGWLKMDDVDVSYPIVQGADNEHYLHYDASDRESVAGAIFIDSRNVSIKDDKHVLVYGHNMMDESMFGQLDNYLDESFYWNGDGMFTIYTPQGSYRYRIFSVAVVDPTDETYTTGYKNELVFDSFVKHLVGQSMYETGINVTGADHVVSLSTCSASDRLVLCAQRVSAQPWEA